MYVFSFTPGRDEEDWPVEQVQMSDLLPECNEAAREHTTLQYRPCSNWRNDEGRKEKKKEGEEKER